MNPEYLRQDAEYVRQAYRQMFGEDPTLGVRQGIQAVGSHETQGSRSWGASGQGSWNVGAVQAHLPPCGEDTFAQQDSKPTSSGQEYFDVCFKRYNSAADGWMDVVKLLTKNRPKTFSAMKAGNLHDMVTDMRRTTYFMGFGPTEADQIAGYEKALAKMVAEIASANGERVAIYSSGVSSPFNSVALLAGIGAGIAITAWAWPEISELIT